ncbi:hypothetical protein RJ639_005182 [Escallonia herrerae]|uniref:IST1-like protein n=1 Tax=Escallonia herrerae TaxID=1293975 RepID=A0AA88VZV1_9ASTE|nr:hypothetical protein RJ639_005182 [Escallonia herrerae]
MTVASAATRHCKKAMKFGISIFRRGFNSSKCKTSAKMAVARIKLLRNKRQVVVKQMRRDIALLLQSGQDATARIRVEHVIREQNIMAANEFLELFCELIVTRLSIIAKRRECPEDLKEGIASLIFAAPRCSDIPELLAIQDIFEKKYGRDFTASATDLRPSCGVNRMLIDKLSVRTPAGEVKLKVMKEIAKEYQVEWDTKESELELLKPPEELIEGPRTFVSATSLPIKPTPKQSIEPSDPTGARYSDKGEGTTVLFEDTASAAEAAAESAKQAIAAAGAAAYLASKGSYQATQVSGFNTSVNGSDYLNGCNTTSGNQAGRFMQSGSQRQSKTTGEQSEVLGRIKSQSSERSSHSLSREEKIDRRHSYNVPHPHSGRFEESDYDEEMETDDPTGGVGRPAKQPTDARMINRRHSYNAPSVNSDIKFDETESDEEDEIEGSATGTNLPPNRPAPHVPRAKKDPVLRPHPKLPDYDEFAARFEALKYRKI